MAKLLLEENDILAEDVTGDDVEGTVEAAKIIIDQLPKDKDKNKWLATVTKIIDELPKETYVVVADILNSTGGKTKVDDQTKQVVANEVDADMETANGWNTVADILKYVDLAALAKEDPKKAKAILIAVLTIISIVEPTPIGEVITLIVGRLSNDTLAEILKALGYLSPMHWLRQGVLKLANTKEEKVTEDLDTDLIQKLRNSNVDYKFAKNAENEDFLVVDGWENVQDIQKILKPEFEAKDKYDTTVLDDIFGSNNWGFSDSYMVCDECNKVIELHSYNNPNKYFVDRDEGMVYCDECVKKDPANYIDFLINNPQNANTILNSIELTKQGFHKITDKFEFGWYGQTDNPKTILDKVLKEHPNGKFIFNIINVQPLATQFELWGKDTENNDVVESLSESKDTLQERLIEFDPNEWNEEDIEFWHTIDWSARNYNEFEKTDDVLKNQTVERVGEGEGPNKKIVDMVKVFRPNPIYPPYYRAIENPFPECVGPMYDGNTYGKVHIHDRYETPETYDMLSR